MPIKVKNEPGLIRDEHSKAIISTDSSSHQRYLAQREKIKRERELVETTTTQISEIKEELNTLKNLVLSLVETINNQSKK
jgi:5-methylcytosine-specific restriction endonuclease McrBC GTP-binding regulatory subunit McrB